VHHGKVLRTEEPLLPCVGHVEADTKIVFHACKLDSDAHVTIRCSDTDILVIMLGNMNFIPNDLKISMHVGTGNHQRVRYGASKELETPYFVEGCVARTLVTAVPPPPDSVLPGRPSI
jgi:hypothetical protein